MLHNVCAINQIVPHVDVSEDYLSALPILIPYHLLPSSDQGDFEHAHVSDSPLTHFVRRSPHSLHPVMSVLYCLIPPWPESQAVPI